MIQIRPIDATDIQSLIDISRQTFTEAFAAHNTEENMRQYLDQAFDPAKLLQELSQPGARFYFAELNGRPVGYLKLNTGAAQSDLRDQDGMELERIYVLQSAYGTGVGKALLEKAIAEARAEHRSYLWLGVWEHNDRAIRFYARHGFTEFGKHPFMLGDDVQTDLLMRLDLHSTHE